MQKKPFRNLLLFGVILFTVSLSIFYILISRPQPQRSVGVKAFTHTTCETLKFKGAPPMLGQAWLDDLKNTVCTNTTPQFDGGSKCYTNTLVCSNDRLDSPYWCVSSQCYMCMMEEVDIALCKPGASEGMSGCKMNEAKWKADPYKCDYGAKQLEYNKCSPDRYKCKCDDAGKYRYPTLQQDTSCPDTTVKVTCEMKPLLIPFMAAYNAGDYKKAFAEMKTAFQLRSTQVKLGSTGCFMPNARLIESGSGYCGYLQLDSTMSLGCSCWQLMEAQNNGSTYDYARMKEIDYCKTVIAKIKRIVESPTVTPLPSNSPSSSGQTPIPAPTSVGAVNITPSAIEYSYGGNKLPWNGYIVNSDNCLLQNGELTGYVGNPSTLQYTTAKEDNVCFKKSNL